MSNSRNRKGLYRHDLPLEWPVHNWVKKRTGL